MSTAPNPVPASRVVEGNRPLWLAGDRVWRVRSGELDLFVVARTQGRAEGRRRYVGALGSGDLVFEVESASEHQLLAVGVLGTEVEEVTEVAGDDPGLASWRALFGDEDPRAAALAFLAGASTREDERSARTQARVAERTARSRRLLNRAIRGLTDLRLVGRLAWEAPAGDMPFALAHAARAEGMTPPASAFEDLGEGDARSQLDRFGRRARVRCRSVLLRGRWYESDSGSLVAFENRGEEAPRPVALIRTRRGYHLLAAGEAPVAVDEAVSGRLTGEAYQLYAGFPKDVVTPLDLVRFAMRGRRREAILVAGLGLAGAAVSSAVPLATAAVFGTVIPNADRSLLGLVFAALFGLGVASAVFRLSMGLAQLRLESLTTASSQAAVWDRLLSLPMGFFRQFGTGDLTQRASGIEQIRSMISSTVLQSVMAFVFSLSSFGLLFYFDVQLALAAIVLVAISGVVAVVSALIDVRLMRESEQARGETSNFLLENISGIAKLRAAGAEAHAFAEWSKRFAKQWSLTYRSTDIQNDVQTFTGAYPLFCSMVLFFIVGNAGGEIETADYVAFSAAFSAFNGAALGLINAGLMALRVVPLYERARPILETAPEVPTDRLDDIELMGRIEVSRVSFGYSPDSPVLEDVSFDVPAGKMVALVGPSGSGKSTLVRLILGFETPTSGAIYFDDRDLLAVNAESVRRSMGVVTQTGEVLGGSILENIRGPTEATLDEVWAAAEKAALADDIRAMPMGMHTLLQPRGGTLSGGQRQRLRIARALVNEPKILVLDEATSALDNRTQSVVTESLQALGVTRLVIAHRLSTIERADLIVHLEDGRVTEQGTYEELMAMGGAFAKLARRQQA